MSTVLSGDAKPLGVAMRAGVEAAFAEVNRDGGLHGRPLRLVAYDDGYEPARTIVNMKRLVADERVLAVVGNVGTPTAVVAIPLAAEAKVPFVGAFTGAAVLRRTPPNPYVVNFRAGYMQEASAIVDALVTRYGVRPQEVGFFTQRDAYGDAGYAAGVAALRSRGLPAGATVPHGRYDRNTVAVEDAVAELLSAGTQVRAVMMFGTAAPTAAFVGLARRCGLDATFVSASFVGVNDLARRLGAVGDGVIVTQVVPHVGGDEPVVRRFRAAIDDGHRDDFAALEGYVVGRMLCHVAARAGGPPGRGQLLAAVDGAGAFDLGLGIPLALSPARRQASDAVWATVLTGGQIRPLDWKDATERTRAR